MATLLQSLDLILRRRQRAGQKTVWLSEANRQLLTAIPAAKPPRPAATPAPPQPAAVPVWPRPASTPVAAPRPTAPPPIPQPAAAPSSCPARSPEFLRTVKEADWNRLCELVGQCNACPLAPTRHNLVFEDGCRQARLMFIGEGPGQDEDMQGIPFVGRAGQLLTNMIKAMGLDRHSLQPTTSVYIANIVKCRPPQNRNPQPEEVELCLPFLHRQIELVQPEAIVLLGAVALKGLLGLTGISKLRGTWQEYRGIPVMPTFHPAYILRCERQPTLFVEEKRKVWNDLQAVMARLNIPLPKRPAPQRQA